MESIPVQPKSRRLPAAAQRELWDRWRNGQSLSEIGRALGKHAATISGVLSRNGGISPRVRKRSPYALQSAEREEISRGLSVGDSYRQIAARLGRSVSTISREVHRNGGRIAYRATNAEKRAWDRGRRPKACLLAQNVALQRFVAEHLQNDWSPQQIAGWLKRHDKGDGRMRVSHETIYKSLFIQARGVLKRELMKHLRSRRLMRRAKQASSQETGERTSIVDPVSIRERPPEADDRSAPGHWEGDLIAGSKNSHIATLVERQSRFTILVQVDGRDTRSVIAGLTREVGKLPLHLKQSLTWDRGGELAGHKAFSMSTDMAVYFCDPYSPWQRGSNENTNRLLRQYFPKKTDVSGFTQEDLDQVAQKLNTRPRKTLDYQTPAEAIEQLFALTA